MPKSHRSKISNFFVFRVSGESASHHFENTKTPFITYAISYVRALKFRAKWSSNILPLRFSSKFCEINNEKEVKFEDFDVIVLSGFKFQIFVFWLSGESASHHFENTITSFITYVISYVRALKFPAKWSSNILPLRFSSKFFRDQQWKGS